MATHPYISGPANIQQMVGLLRKSFPATVTSDTVKKYSLAPNNESYVINALQFLGFLDTDGKKTDLGASVFTKHEDDEFHEACGVLIRNYLSFMATALGCLKGLSLSVTSGELTKPVKRLEQGKHQFSKSLLRFPESRFRLLLTVVPPRKALPSRREN